MTSLATMPPQQVVCGSPSCKRRQNVPLTDLYWVQVRNRSGGSHREAACRCRVCKHEIAIPPAYLRKGVLQMLQSKAEHDSSRTPDPRPATDDLPAWRIGADALAMLDSAIGRIATGGGDLIGLTVEDGVQLIVEMPSDRKGILETLDEEGCHLLVGCGPNPDGSKWQVVLHPASGATTLASAA